MPACPLLVEGRRGAQEVRVGVGRLLQERLHGRLLALGLLGEGLGHLLHGLRLLLELAHGALEDLLGELRVGLHDGDGLLDHRLQGLHRPLRHLLRGLVHVLGLALIHRFCFAFLAVARDPRMLRSLGYTNGTVTRGVTSFRGYYQARTPMTRSVPLPISA